jgi:zinc transport system permease protein
MTDWLQKAIEQTALWIPSGWWLADSFAVRALLAIVLVSVLCGAVGSQVVGNRMAFFSDALAHSAFAGITLGFIVALAVGENKDSMLIPLVMVAVGVLVGVAINFVREHTGLSNDTVIGVFFAAAVGFGGMLFGAIQGRAMNPESFLFGSPLFVFENELLVLLVLALVLAFILVRRYNHFVLASFSPSLARSRRVPIQWCNYLFIIILALIVNLCIKAVGALLINAMLVVPAATAANFGRNLRQMFWTTIAFSFFAGIGGLWISNAVRLPIPGSEPLEFGPSGTTVVLSVLLFFVSVAWKSWSERAPRLAPSLAVSEASLDNATNAREPGPTQPA